MTFGSYLGKNNMSEPILVAKNTEAEYFLLPQMANRHGVITGATGTGKTVTLQKLAEGFSSRGVPVFMADIKGDLTGVTQAGGGLGCFRQAGTSAQGDRFGNGPDAHRPALAAQ